MRVLVLALRRIVCVVACLVTPGVAAAQCMQCNPFLQCVSGTSGARLCFESAGMCTLLLPCLGGGARESDPGVTSEGDQLTTLSLFDAVPSVAPLSSARRVANTPLALGDEIRGELPLGTVADVAVAHGRAFDAVFTDEAGEGYAVTRAVEAGGVRLEVRAVHANVVGAVLAAETLGERERLTVPVRVDGRDRVLVLQARDGHGRGDEGELRRLRRTIDGVRRRSAPRETPWLKVRAR
jgi:hypothetical protein